MFYYRQERVELVTLYYENERCVRAKMCDTSPVLKMLQNFTETGSVHKIKQYFRWDVHSKEINVKS